MIHFGLLHHATYIKNFAAQPVAEYDFFELYYECGCAFALGVVHALCGVDPQPVYIEHKHFYACA
jgi:hypothetical protein